MTAGLVILTGGVLLAWQIFRGMAISDRDERY